MTKLYKQYQQQWTQLNVIQYIIDELRVTVSYSRLTDGKDPTSLWREDEKMIKRIKRTAES